MFPLLLDANNLAKRAIMASAIDDLRAGRTWTGGVYGALTSLTSLIKYLAQNDSAVSVVVAVWDDGVPGFRMNAIPEYKAHRKNRLSEMSDEDQEKCFQQMPLIRELLAVLGCVNVSRPSWEADDLIGAYALHGSGPRLIASSDKDLWQCVAQPGCGVWDLGHKRLVDQESYPEAFVDAFDAPVVPIAWLPVFRALVGDASDGVPGVRGIGPKTAAKLINAIPGVFDIVSLAAQMEAVAAAVSQPGILKSYHAIGKQLGYVRTVAEVNAICVPRLGLKAADFAKMPRRGKMERREVLQFCQRLSFRSVMGDPDHYLKPFEAMQ
jgi:5'-3' exonuclease